MGIPLPSLPNGWPWSLWFLAATIVLYLLQRFPLTGVFLMVVGAAYWSVILVNLGIIGIGYEALVGKVSRLWLIVPLVYFGSYYWLYSRNQTALAALRVEYAKFNDGKLLKFDPATQDLVTGTAKGGSSLSPSSFVPHYGLGRAFDGNGRMALVADREACALLSSNDVYRSAGIYLTAFKRDWSKPKPKFKPADAGLCAVSAPGLPEKPIVRVVGEDSSSTHAGMPLTTQTFYIKDEAKGRGVVVKHGIASPLKPFPMPVMGCALNSGAGKWQCFHGFMRDTRVSVVPTGEKYGGGTVIVARALGLNLIEDFAHLATGPEEFRAIGDAADAELTKTEITVLEQMLANPTANTDDSFRHLPKKPEIISAYADRLFGALAVLQVSDKQISDTGSNLWRLVAALPEEVLAPYRTKLVEWLKPGNARPWTLRSQEIYTRLDVEDPVQLEIVLQRLEAERGDIKTNLLPPFCRLGAGAPEEAKSRLLALWQSKGREALERRDERPQDHVVLYLTLARMGLKEQAGKVEQRYYGPTFLSIWESVTPSTHAEACSGSAHEVSNYFSKLKREQS